MSLDRFRNRRKPDRPQVTVPPYNLMKRAGEFFRFNGGQRTEVYAVGKEKLTRLLIVQDELREGHWLTSRFITMSIQQVEAFLGHVEAAEKLGIGLMALPADDWDLPKHIGDATDDESVVRTELEAFRGRVELKIIRTVPGGGSLPNWEWTKIGPRDCEKLIELVVAAHDLINPQRDVSKGTYYEEPTDF